MKKLCLLLAFIMLFLCGCNAQDDDSGRRRRKDRETEEEIQEITTVTEVSRMGYAVAAGENIYYWQYDSSAYGDGALMGFFTDGSPATLVRLDKEGETKELVTSRTASVFVHTGGSIYYVDIDQIYHLNLDTLETTLVTAGALVDVDEAGSYLIISLDGKYHSYNIAKQEFTALFSDGSYEGYNNGVVYYSTRPSDGNLSAHGQVNLHAVNIDGIDPRLLVTTQPDLYDYSGTGWAEIEQLRFSDDAAYFSYGSVAGSGGFYQGGKIMRVPFDGSTPEVVAGQDELVSADFGINSDGSVTVYEDSYTPYYSGHTQYFESQEGLFWMDRKTGVIQKLMGLSDYETLIKCDAAFVSLCDVWENVSILTLNYTDIDPSQAMGWRDYYVRLKTVTYKLENGVLTELYSF